MNIGTVIQSEKKGKALSLLLNFSKSAHFFDI